MGKIQVIGTRNFTELKTARDYFTFRSGSNAMRVCYNTHHVRALEQTCKDLIVMIRDPHAWPSFATELKAIKTMEICFPNFKISHIPRAQNRIADSLVKAARSFYRELCYID